MIHALWSLINIGLFIFFVSICFRATKLVRENLGLLASLVFVFGLLSFAGNQSSSMRTGERAKKWTFSPKDGVTPGTINYRHLTVDKSLTLAIDLGIQYGRDTTSLQLVPIEANSGMMGFVSGYHWEPVLIAADPTQTAGKLTYTVHGLLRWNLLGVPIYTQPKRYLGFVDLNAGQ